MAALVAGRPGSRPGREAGKATGEPSRCATGQELKTIAHGRKGRRDGLYFAGPARRPVSPTLPLGSTSFRDSDSRAFLVE